MHEQRGLGSSFGDMLRRARRDAGLTQEELAERAGLSVRGISDLERGARSVPRRDTVELLGAALGMPDSEIQRWLTSTRTRNSMSGLKPPATTLFGREHETSTLHRAIDAARSGRGSVVLIGGEPGVGKTSLAEHASAYAQQHGARSLGTLL
jgi:transcriptional regulator with XRE-family HTH domain